MTTARPLPRLWRRLDSGAALVGVEAAWRGGLGDDYDAIAEYFVDEREPSATFPCPLEEAGPDCPRRVIVHTPSDIVAVCGSPDDDCEPVLKLTPNDIVSRALHLAPLARRIAALVALDGGGVEAVLGGTSIFRLCCISTRDGAVPIFLAFQTEGGGAVERLLSRTVGPLALILPTERSLARVADALAMRGGVAVVASAIIGWARGRGLCVLGEAPDWRRLLGRDGDRPVESDAEAPGFCMLVGRGGRRAIREDEYRAIVDARDLDLLIDMTGGGAGGTYPAARRDDSGRVSTASLSKNEALALVEIITAGRALRAGELRSIQVNAPAKVIEHARRKVDVSLGRRRWRALQTLPGPGANQYLFKPPADLRYALLLPLEANPAA
jgi:hypothetical protein